jgi:DNA invertase Pin-like site-specific DNA recombinase
MIAVYERISTAKQDFESQHTAILQHLERTGSLDSAQFYQDTVSGGRFDREGLDRLLADVSKGRIREVICWRLCRLGRSLSGVLQVLNHFQRHGVGFLSLSDNIDTRNQNPMARLQIQMLAAFSEFEKECLRSRIACGIDAARKRGAKFGRPPIESGKRGRVKELLNQGVRPAEVARETQVSLPTVYRIRSRD